MFRGVKFTACFLSRDTKTDIAVNEIEKKLNTNIPEILKKYKKIVVVGISDKSERDSYRVAKFMLEKGYTIYPVNPNFQEIFGLRCYSSLPEIPQPVELVDIFRKSEFVLPIVEEAIQIGVKAVWMQYGVINPAAAQKALQAGLEVVMDRCWKQEYQNYF
jgi:predicted CoA-binding protein